MRSGSAGGGGGGGGGQLDVARTEMPSALAHAKNTWKVYWK